MSMATNDCSGSRLRCGSLVLVCFLFRSQMSSAGPKEAIDAINACELSTVEKAAARAKCVDANVVAIITATPAAERAETIRQLLAPSQASSSAQDAG